MLRRTWTRLADRLGASAFVRGSVWTIAGNGAGHAAVLVASPVLSRLYTPEHFGAYGAFLAVLMMVVAVAGLRYEIAIQVPTSDAVATRLAVVALAIVVISAGIAGVVAALARWTPAGLEAAVAAPMLALGVVGLGGYQVLAAWSTRRRDYRELALSRTARSLTQVALQLVLGFAGWAGSGLVGGHVAGGGAGVVRMGRSFLAAVRTVSLAPRALAAAAVAHWRFPVYSAPSGLLNSAGNQVPLLVVLAAFGPEVAGGFAFAQRIVAAPVVVVGQAIAQVFVGEFGAQVRARAPSSLRLYRRTLVRLFAVGFVPVVLLAIAAPAAFVWVFGPAWGEAGTFVRALTPMLLVQFAVVPVSSVLNLLERTRAQLAYDVIRLVAGVGSMAVVAALGGSAIATVATYAVGMAVAYALNVAFGYFVLRGELARGIRSDR